MKKNAVIRVWMSELRCFADYLLPFLGVIAFFGFMWYYADMMSPGYLVSLFGAVIPLTMTLQRYIAYFPQIVGYGATRKSFILGGLLMKPVYILFALIITLSAWFLDPRDTLASTLIYVGLLSLTGAFLGELLGVIMLKLGKIGFVIYMIFYIGFFMSCGAFSALRDMNDGFSELYNALPIFLSVTAAAVLVVGSIVPCLMLRRIEVR